MNYRSFLAVPLLAVLLVAGQAGAAPARAEVPLHYAPNDVKAGEFSFQILRGFVGNLTASGFDSYTVFLKPDKAGEPWLHVTMPSSQGLGYNLRSYESGDANLVAVSFYKEGGQLYAVEAERTGTTPAERLKKGAVQFKLYKFNGDTDVPMFERDEVVRAKVPFQHANEALKKEFFGVAGK